MKREGPLRKPGRPAVRDRNLSIQRPVGPEGFVGEGLDGIEAAGEQLLDFGLVCVLGEEPFAVACAPDLGELVFAEEDIGRVGVAGAPEQRGALAMLAAAREHQERRLAWKKLVRIKDDRRGVGLVAVDDEGVGGRAFGDDGVGHGLGAEHGLEAGKGDVRGDEEDGQGEGDADGGGEVLLLQAQQPAGGGADEQSDGGEDGGQAQRGKRGAGEVEEVGHGERVVANGAMRQQGADVGDIGQIARDPESPGEGGGGEHADDGEGGLRAGEPGGGEQGVLPGGAPVRGAAVFFDAGHDAGDEDESGGQTGKV